jgi:hypothetical protein
MPTGSRFIVRNPSEDARAEAKRVEEAKARLGAGARDYIEEEVVKLRETLPAEIDDMVKKVQEFYLHELLPIVVASRGGAKNAKDIAEAYFREEVDETAFNQAARYATIAVNIRLATFTAELYGLPPSAVGLLMSGNIRQATITADELLNEVNQMVKRNA